jgi:hypothetical protein
MAEILKRYKEESRKDWGTEQINSLDKEQITLGAILRIADATEALAENHNSLIRDNNYLTDRVKELRDAKYAVQRSNTALKGHVTRLRKRIKLINKEHFDLIHK